MCALSHLDGASAHRLHLLPTSDSNSTPLIHDRHAAGSPEISDRVSCFLSTRDYISLPQESRRRKGGKNSISCVNRLQQVGRGSNLCSLSSFIHHTNFTGKVLNLVTIPFILASHQNIS